MKLSCLRKARPAHDGQDVGVALVAVTQMVIWGILLALMSAYLLPALMPADAMADVAAVQSGNFDSISDQSSIEIIQAVGMLGNVSHILSLIALMTVFLVFGFLLYSSIFAAVGSSVDNIQDASQLTSFAVFPIIFGLIFAMVAATDPMGSVAFWMSMFPLTSPMVMVARIPFGIPAWEIALSLVLLAIGFIAMVWLAGKNLSCRHLHVWQKAIDKGTDPLGQLQINIRQLYNINRKVLPRDLRGKTFLLYIDILN